MVVPGDGINPFSVSFSFVYYLACAYRRPLYRSFSFSPFLSSTPLPFP
jgi:hypothetical protein